ncbi:phosphate ABC transporter substrate-binding protein PstS [Streptomyces diastatochromogenes]|uniref:Phosphate ABC transporter substrate-binding protein n=1 Tax=Streptomyces diastatochromogenes TaxID=42236 RepID=A0A233SSX7_STRDA|nr:phosphate ABC transporter substrate-binding protein PstS [Streptomyces diastatochromogenes]MCZ0987639.1 phosphate ABC transporter substrate-binding protein PstS [Streptomyces diastatochromogenes]OXY98751.1 phosphate ABC transporter substrate-binding protein [Streptomyces diastatochromogenes]
MLSHLTRALRRLGILAALIGILTTATPASADSYTPISGAGSTWAENAVDEWRRAVNQYGMRISYAGTGSSDGRRQFLSGTVDFAVSDIPFQTHPTDGSAAERPAAGSYAYMPIVAGGTVFMYHLTVNGKRVTNLRLSGDVVTKIFTGVIKTWDDPAIRADNPGLQLPHRTVVPVVRSDGSGSSAQFTLWMTNQHKALWQAYCRRVGRSGSCGQTSIYPTVPGMIAQSGDLGVAGYIAQNYGEGAIGYVNYSYALNAHYPVAKVLNHSGYYTEPTPQNVAVSLLKARINTNKSSPDYLTQQLDGVYNDSDRRNYPLSSYSYMILPLKVRGTFSQVKGKTLGAFSYYFMCQGQQQAPKLGYSPLPINLVKAGFDQIRRIPGVQAQNINIKRCNNPTFTPDGHNRLADTAPYPKPCDKKGAAPCTTGSGGAKSDDGNGGSGGGSSAGGTTSGGSSGTGGNGTAGTGGSGGPSVDPDTGQTIAPGASAGGGSGGGGTGAANTVALAQPVAVAAGHGWTATQTLMLLAAFLVLGLVLLPSVVSRLVGARSHDTAKDGDRR